MITRCLALCVLILQASTAAWSETVLVRSGVNYGQGWIFKDGSDCRLVTVAHVVDLDSGILVSGNDGDQGQVSNIKYDNELDIATGVIIGAIAERCPIYASPLGDRDTGPVLRRLINEGRNISMERRYGLRDGGDYGLGIISVQVDALPETQSYFRLRLARPDDEVIQSDSGSPIRLRGSGLGEAGLPLGLVRDFVDIDGVQDIRAVRIDAVRTFIEGEASSNTAASALEVEEALDYDIVSFDGLIKETGCGPLNLKRPQTLCGWRVTKDPQMNRPSLLLKLAYPTEVSRVHAEFQTSANAAEGLSVSTSSDGERFSGDRYCMKLAPEANEISCTVSPRKARWIRIILEGNDLELVSLDIG